MLLADLISEEVAAALNRVFSQQKPESKPKAKAPAHKTNNKTNDKTNNKVNNEIIKNLAADPDFQAVVWKGNEREVHRFIRAECRFRGLPVDRKVHWRLFLEATRAVVVGF